MQVVQFCGNGEGILLVSFGLLHERPKMPCIVQFFVWHGQVWKIEKRPGNGRLCNLFILLFIICKHSITYIVSVDYV